MAKDKYSKMQLATMSADELEKEIRYHNIKYWDDQTPEISDYEYDRLVERLKEVKPDSAVLSDFGSERFGESVTHATPMLSLDKCYTDEDLISWSKKFDGDVVVTPKMDGIACSIRYDDNGDLTVAATRGSGTDGDDITVNVRTIKDIPNSLKDGAGLEVRGEIYMKLSVFDRYREQFANPRNLAAGAIKQKDPDRCKAYGLSFMAYDLIGANVERERDKFKRLVKLGFPKMDHKIAGQDKLPEAYQYFAKKRDKLDYEIDGVVFKTDTVAEQQRMGATAHHPRYGMAYKFQGDSGTTTLEGIEWSVARTGAITPVALIKPVTLSGASVGRASLHHAGFIDKLGLTEKAEVVITRRGGVIPNLEFVSKPGKGKKPVKVPDKCPSCGGAVKQDGDFLYCKKPAKCRDAVIGTIEHFCKVIDLQGFGGKILAEAYDKKILRTPADLYGLDRKTLLKLERVGDKLADKLVARVGEKRELELAVFLRSLGVDELGKHVSKILEDNFGTLKKIQKVKASELAAIHTIGDIIAEKVVGGLDARTPLINQLLEQVKLITPADRAKKAKAAGGGGGGELAGKSFVFTGKLLAFDRKTAQKKVKDSGGEAPSGVTKTLDYLVIGDGKEGKKSSKQVKAEKYVAAGAELKIITETDFKKMIGE